MHKIVWINVHLIQSNFTNCGLKHLEENQTEKQQNYSTLLSKKMRNTIRLMKNSLMSYFFFL